jgi:hypothetical protein
MAAPWYTPTGSPATNATGSSAVIRAEFIAIEDAFDLMPVFVADAVVVVNAGASALTTISSVPIIQGGTGATTFTDGGVLLGSGTSAIRAMAVLADGEMIVGDGTTDPVAESGATLRTSIGLGTLATASNINNSDWSGADLVVANGGTGVSTLTDGGVLLGSGTGAVTAMAVLLDGEMIVGDGTTDPVAESGATLRTSIGLGSLATQSNINNTDWSGADLVVANGGTGASTLTDGGVLLGSGTGAVTPLARASNGQLVIGSNSADPVLATLTAGTNITINNTAGGIEIIASGGGSGSVTNVATAGTENGLTLTGGPITTTGTITLGGTLAISNADWSGADLVVANGGTGVSTLTDGGLMLGSGTGAVTSLAQATNGQIPIGSTGFDPVLATITGGSGIDVNVGAGTIEIVSTAGGGTVTSILTTGTVNGMTLTGGEITTTGTLTLGGTLAINNSDWSGTDLSVANGGTGASTFTDGGVLLGSGTGAITAMGVLANGAIIIGDGAGDPVALSAFSSSTGTLKVANGGTGKATLTDGGLMLGSGTGAVTSLAQGTNGQLVIASTGVDPVLATITAGTNIAVVNGAGSITLNATGSVSSVASAGTVSGLTLTGGPITSTGTLTLGGTLAINNSDWSGTDLAVVNGGTGSSTAAGARTNLGVGSIGTQSSIDGGDWSGADLALADGGTGASTAADARTNLGLGTLAVANDINNSDWSGDDLVVANGGTGVSTLTAGGLLLGSGTAAVTAMGVLADGAIVIGDGVGDPVQLSAFSSSTGTLKVANGGTGASTLTNGGIVLGSGTGAVTVLAQATNGQIPIGRTGLDPILALITGGSGIDVNVGSGTIEIVNTGSGGTVTNVATAGTENGLTLTGGPITGTGTITLGGTLAISNSDWSGTDLSVANGGTGASTLTSGGVLLGSGTGAITAMAVLTDGQMIVGDGVGDPVAESGTTLRTSIGVAIGSDVQAHDANLDQIAALAPTDSNFIVGNGSAWVLENAATARTSLGLGALALLATVDNSNWSGADLAVVNGGTGSSTASGARTNLGVTIGSQVQAWDAQLDTIAGLASTNSNFIVGNGSSWVAETGSTARSSLGLGSLATLSTINNGNWSGTDLSVSNGGTGASTLTNGGVLLGSGTGAITAMGVLANGAMIVGDGSADPVAESGTTLRTSIGLGTGNTATFAALVVPGHLITTVTGNTTNTRLGSTAGDAIATGGVQNVAIGNTSLSTLTTGDDNVAIGHRALIIYTGSDNTAVGSGSMDSCTSGSFNAAFGFNTLSTIGTGTGCAAMGSGALSACTGNNNVGLGNAAGNAITSGADNTMLGQGTDVSTGTGARQISIGKGVTCLENDQVSIGSASSRIRNEFDSDNAWTQTSDRRKKREVKTSKLGLSFINDLRPVTYKWKPASEFPVEWNIEPDAVINTNIIMTGLIAQEVEEALKKANIGVRFAGWKKDCGDGQRISKEMFVFPLINAVNELTARLEKLERMVA